ncbi:Complex I intermediate-associated protein 30 [Penicillium atrosanguineum]|uniref:SET domain-containing protein n=1 Tax=Penicillium atrosanguineum TaxID=1132637 RepID=A0A9W9TZ57_9EURO|nr:Complex I intermediate-associated protein 30 [Penicillium atrosanguineum]KAJ5296674.1 Complex I intermediate-associated protein 30 [Penicillium atrosanguineum]KAJ5299436.1 hypothetical protein N7476_010993 [Penicillium atrosanguineum]
MSTPTWWPGEDHAAFTEWALAQGVIANGVTPARFPGRGLGMIATRAIKSGEPVVQVPTSAIMTIETLPDSFRAQFLEGTPVQAIMAAYLTHGSEEELSKYALWRKAWPSRQDFEDSLPMLWPTALGGLVWPDTPAGSGAQANVLPPCISGRWNSIQKDHSPKKYDTEHQNLLAGQEQRLGKAWADVKAVLPETDWRDFSYHWLILNTRSFYWVGPDQEPPEDRNDAMALLPFADYFNHSDVECDVKFDADEYTLCATEDYEEGDEVYMSYGSHPNDFLLAEYGFFLEQNESDCVYLDDIIFRDITSADKREELALNQYYGNYQVTWQGVCYRTEVAACLKYMKEEDWRNHVLEGSTEGVDENLSENIIKGWLQTYCTEADAAVNALRAAMESDAVVQANHQKAETLLRRWAQIKGVCESASMAIDL